MSIKNRNTPAYILKYFYYLFKNVQIKDASLDLCLDVHKRVQIKFES